MQSQHDIHEQLAILRRQQEDHQKLLITMQSLMIRAQPSMGPTAPQLTGIVTLVGCVTLVDATGHNHAILLNFCTSFQQLNKMLQVLFECDSIEAHIQRRYVEEGQYDLCIDEGTQVAPLTSHEWSSMPADTKIVMKIIIQQETTSFSDVDYQCHFCGAVNHLGVGSVVYSLQRQAGCSIDCRICKRRFQISRERAS